ncbi:MAG TPA: hypothetical protein VGJ40_07580 [Gaiellaceae bacterium]|jgi:hypothetical protein
MVPPRSTPDDRRRFRVRHALRAVDDAIALLEPAPADGIETDALARVRDDLALILRLAEADRR